MLTIFCLLWHNFDSRYARKPIKGSKDSDDSLDSKRSWGKILAHWIGVEGRPVSRISQFGGPKATRRGHIF